MPELSAAFGWVDVGVIGLGTAGERGLFGGDESAIVICLLLVQCGQIIVARLARCFGMKLRLIGRLFIASWARPT